MRRRRWLAAALLVLLLSGCAEPGTTAPTVGSNELPTPTQTNSKAPAADSAEELTDPAVPADTQESQGIPTAPARPEPTETEPGGTDPARTEPTASQPAATAPAEPDEARPRVLSLGLYEGPFPEDGSGEAVDSAAVILVENDSETQLQFAELHYTIDGREALFRVSELPPGEQALVVEHNRLVAMPVSVWEAAPEEDLIVYLAAEAPDSLEIRCEQAGRLTVKNLGGEAASFDLIYKQRGEDGIFLGGIAYHAAVPLLQAGQTAELEAPHFTEASVVVRVTAKAP